jgi:hypothetical protein
MFLAILGHGSFVIGKLPEVEFGLVHRRLDIAAHPIDIASLTVAVVKIWAKT